MESEEIYQIVVMSSLIVSAGTLIYIANSLGEIRDSLRYFYKEPEDLKKDLRKAKRLENKVKE